jgi:hypothetical protein
MRTGYSAKKNNSRSIYGIYRKIRFLKRRGTLFRKIPRERPVRSIDKPKNKSSNSIYRVYRIIRFLFHTGKLFRRKTTERPVLPNKIPQKPNKERIYHMYRMVRFLYHTGKLFKRKENVKKEKGRNNLKIIYRKIRYLRHRRKLWTAFWFGTIKFFQTKLSFLRSGEYLIILINSTALFLLAYFLIYLVTQFSVMIAAITFNIDTVLYYYEIDFLIRGSEWVPDAVKVVYTTGPFVSLILGILAIIVYVKLEEETWVSRLFILWLFCHAFIHFFGELLMGNLLGQGFGYVVMYLIFQDTPKMVLTLVDFMIILFSGLALGRIFLFTGNIYLNQLDKSNRMPFVYSQFLLPFLIGTGIILLIKLPEITSLEICVDFSMLILLLPVIFRARTSHDLFFEEDKKIIKPFWILLIATIIVSVLFRIILGTGIRL